MSTTLILNANVVNEGITQHRDVYIQNDRIVRIEKDLQHMSADTVIDAAGQYLIPGLIDDQVHFREPGLTHKAEIYTESRAAVAGGITSFMEMPNTVPNTLTQQLLEEKYQVAARNSLANYSFFIGASNDNLEEVLKTNPENVCGVKIFMGSSTGNMLVDNTKTLEQLFSKVSMLIATHCEDEATIRANTEKAKALFGEEVPMSWHPIIRDHEACYLSSSMAAALAKKHGTRLHILHISTEKETHLFDNAIPLIEKKITSEACVHHLWFSDADYHTKGSHIKWNPAVKTAFDRDGILKALLDDRIDVLATDHAPHTLEEKSQGYFKAPSGGPLVQHTLPALMEMRKQGKISIEKIVEKACHNVAILFGIKERGFIREGYKADLVLVHPDNPWTVSKDNILYKCGWSPFEGERFSAAVTHTWINGRLAYQNGKIIEGKAGEGKYLIFAVQLSKC
jgi:dihydroorotase